MLLINAFLFCSLFVLSLFLRNDCNESSPYEGRSSVLCLLNKPVISRGCSFMVLISKLLGYATLKVESFVTMLQIFVLMSHNETNKIRKDFAVFLKTAMVQ